jgi:hypothetical protein
MQPMLRRAALAMGTGIGGPDLSQVAARPVNYAIQIKLFPSQITTSRQRRTRELQLQSFR